MQRRLKARITIETLLGLASLGLAVVTLIDHEWIEELTGLDPDAGSGLLEWGIVAALAVLALGLGRLALRDRQRLRLQRAG